MQAYVEGLRPWAEDAREQFHKVEPEMEASQRNLAAAYRSTVGHFRVMGLEDWLDLAVYLLAEQAGGAGAYAKSLELVLHFDKKDAWLHIPPDVRSDILGQALSDVQGVSSRRRLATVTCSLAMVLDGVAQNGELKCVIANASSGASPPHSLGLDEIKQLLDEVRLLVSTAPNNRYTFLAAKLIAHWATAVKGSDILRNICFTTAVAYETLFHFVRLRGAQTMLLTRQLKDALVAEGLLPDNRCVVYSPDEVAAVVEHWFDSIGVHIWIFVAVCRLFGHRIACIACTSFPSITS